MVQMAICRTKTHLAAVARKRLISPCCVTAFCECGNSAQACIRRIQYFRVSAIFPHHLCIGQGVPEAPAPHIPKRSLSAPLHLPWLLGYRVIMSFKHSLYIALPVEYLPSDFAVGNRTVVPIVLKGSGTQP